MIGQINNDYGNHVHFIAKNGLLKAILKEMLTGCSFYLILKMGNFQIFHYLISIILFWMKEDKGSSTIS